MKASELIKELQDAIEKHGDLVINYKDFSDTANFDDSLPVDMLSFSKDQNLFVLI